MQFDIIWPTLLRIAGAAMTPETRERMNSLCKRIQEEQDRATFNKLITELNELLAEKSDRLTSIQKKAESNQGSSDITCAICRQPVVLERDRYTDEDGQVVHEGCYMSRIVAPRSDPPSPQHTE